MIFMTEKFVLITGASSGIGKQIALDLSGKFNLILNGRDSKRLKEVKSLCNSKNEHVIWEFDLAKVDQLERSFSEFIKKNGIQISKFIHSAGYMKMVPLKLSGLETLRNSLNINLISASLLTKILIEKKINEKSLDSVVFVSSNISNMGAKALSAYGASKGALDTLMRCLAVELAPRVRVNSILPGAVITEMTKHIFENDEVRSRMEATYPLGIGQPEDISNTVAFLISNQAKWITGQQFTVDGGRSINISG